MKKINYLLLTIVSLFVFNICLSNAKADTLICVYKDAKTIENSISSMKQQGSTNDFIIQTSFASGYKYLVQDTSKSSSKWDDDSAKRVRLFYGGSSSAIDAYFNPLIKNITKCSKYLIHISYATDASQGTYHRYNFWITTDTPDVEDKETLNYIEEKTESGIFHTEAYLEKMDVYEYEYSASNGGYYGGKNLKSDQVTNTVTSLYSSDKKEIQRLIDAYDANITNPEDIDDPEFNNTGNDPSGNGFGSNDISCSGAVNHYGDKACGELYFIPKQLPQITTLLLNLIKIFTPIILIIKGLIDLFKAITGNNEQEITKARSKFFKRLIPAVAVFLVILIVQFVFGLVGTDKENATFLECANCFLNNNCSQTPEDMIKYYCKEYSSSSISYTSLPASNDEQTIRNHIVEVGRQAISKLNNRFIYLTPSERNSTNCLEKFFNGDKCITSNKEKCTSNTCTFYGTDCNGFVAYVYHQALGITNGTEYRFASPSNSSSDWRLIGTADKYFRYNTKINNAKQNISQITSIAKPGDMLGRYCTGGSDSHTHIGIYSGNGRVIENKGGSTGSSLIERSLEEFIRLDDPNCNITILSLKNFDRNTYK